MPENTIAEKKFGFKLGADPEFNYTFQNKRIIAEALLRQTLGNKLPPSDMGFSVGTAGNLGWDGNSATAEIRPNPSEYPATLINNIRQLLTMGARPARLFQMSTFSTIAPVGGHIHFELPRDRALSKQQMTNIHKKLSTFYIPIMMGENKVNLRLRLATGYGQAKDWRADNEKTFEFRVPSAEWLTTPKVAEATLAYLGVVWHEAVNKPSSFRKIDAIYSTEKQGAALQEMVVTEYGLLYKTILKELRKHIKSFELYPAFKGEIDYILSPAKVLMDKKKVDFNIKKGWNLEQDCKIPTRRELHSRKQMKERLAEINVDELVNLIQIPFNQADTNVHMFASELKKIVLAWGWNLRNNYYLFGLKDGVPGYVVYNFQGKFYQPGDKAKMSTIGQCGTSGDLNCIISTCRRMKEKLSNVRSGSPEEERNFLIGLNYKDRIKENMEHFLDIVHSLEKENLKEHPMPTLTNNNGGEIYSIYNKRVSENPAEMIEQQSRFSAAHQRMADFYADPSEVEIDEPEEDYDENDKVRHEAVFKALKNLNK